MFWSKSTSAQTRATEKAQAMRWTMIAGAGMGFAVFAAFYIADAGLKITFASARFLVLVFGFSSLQLSFIPLVLGPLIAGSGGRGTVSFRMGPRHYGCQCRGRDRHRRRLSCNRI